MKSGKSLTGRDWGGGVSREKKRIYHTNLGRQKIGQEKEKGRIMGKKANGKLGKTKAKDAF